MDVLTKRKETPFEMLTSFTKILFDPAGVMGGFGVLLLSVTAIFQDIPGEYTGIPGVLLLLISLWQKRQDTKLKVNADKREQEIHEKRMDVLRRVELGLLDEEKAKFILSHLEHSEIPTD